MTPILGILHNSENIKTYGILREINYFWQSPYKKSRFAQNEVWIDSIRGRAKRIVAHPPVFYSPNAVYAVHKDTLCDKTALHYTKTAVERALKPSDIEKIGALSRGLSVFSRSSAWYKVRIPPYTQPRHPYPTQYDQYCPLFSAQLTVVGTMSYIRKYTGHRLCYSTGMGDGAYAYTNVYALTPCVIRTYDNEVRIPKTPGLWGGDPPYTLYLTPTNAKRTICQGGNKPSLNAPVLYPTVPNCTTVVPRKRGFKAGFRA